MLADPLTEGLIPEVFHNHISHIGIFVDENMV